MTYVKLFLGFVCAFGSIKAVQNLDQNSRLYQDCAGEWIKAANWAVAYGDPTPFIRSVEKGQGPKYDGQACPALKEGHKAALIATVNPQ